MADENGRAAHPLLYVITTLLAINLGVTLWSVARPLQESGVQSAPSQELPETVTKAERKRIMRDFRTYYNAENYDEIYGMFDDLAKVQIQREQVSTMFGGIRAQIGEITNGVYSHFEYKGNRDNMGLYKLYYKLSLKDGLSDSGGFVVDVFYNGERHGILSLHLTMD